MSKHTEEPWEIYERDEYPSLYTKAVMIFQKVTPPSYADVSICTMEGCGQTDKANAARTVACVNACAGINPEAVPEVVRALKDIIEEDGWWLSHPEQTEPTHCIHCGREAIRPFGGDWECNHDDDCLVIQTLAAVKKVEE